MPTPATLSGRIMRTWQSPAVRALWCSGVGSRADAVPRAVDAKVSRLKLLIRSDPEEGNALRQIAPTTAVEIPGGVGRVSDLDSLFPLHCFEDAAARRCLRSCRRHLWNAVRTSWHHVRRQV